MNPISPLNSGLQPLQSLSAGKSAAAEGGQSFKNMLVDGLTQVNDLQTKADHAVEQLFTGGDVNPAEVLTAIQKADLTFQLMMQIRNKLMTAYQEVKDIRI